MKKVNNKAVESFSIRLSEKLFADFFSTKTSITGKEIMSFCEIKQVNLFVIRQVLNSWKKETEKLKSPYFDYSAPEVKDALKDFMQKLSFHIQIHEDDFRALLTDAVTDTLRLIFTPRVFIKEEFSSIEDKSLLSEEKKYFLFNKQVLEAFISGTIDDLDESEFDDEAGFLDSIRTVFPAEIEDFIIDERIDYNAVIVDVNDDYETEQVIKESPIVEADENEDLSIEEEVEEEIAQEIDLSVEKIETEEKPVEVIDNQEEKSTFNEKFSPEKKSSLLDELQKGSITNIRSNIGLNQRFTFLKELFSNDENEFNRAIDNLEIYDDYETASNYLIQNYAQKHDWEEKEEVATELFQLLSRRY